MEAFPAGPEPEYHPEARPKPESVKTAVNLIWVGVAISVLSTLISFFMLDDIIDELMATDTSGISEDAARASAVFGIVISVIIGIALAALFAHFIGKGANWARIVYTVLTAIGILLGVLGLGSSQPFLLLLLGLASLAVSIATLYFLYRPESNAYFKAS